MSREVKKKTIFFLIFLIIIVLIIVWFINFDKKILSKGKILTNNSLYSIIDDVWQKENVKELNNINISSDNNPNKDLEKYLAEEVKKELTANQLMVYKNKGENFQFSYSNFFQETVVNENKVELNPAEEKYKKSFKIIAEVFAPKDLVLEETEEVELNGKFYQAKFTNQVDIQAFSLYFQWQDKTIVFSLEHQKTDQYFSQKEVEDYFNKIILSVKKID